MTQTIYDHLDVLKSLAYSRRNGLAFARQMNKYDQYDPSTREDILTSMEVEAEALEFAVKTLEMAIAAIEKNRDQDNGCDRIR